MGWMNEEHPGHEGYVVALVEREDAGLGSGLYRELQSPADNVDRSDVVRIQAACDCGWRSPYLVPEKGSEGNPYGSPIPLPSWFPFTAWVSEEDEERCVELWRAHIREHLPVRSERAIELATGAVPGSIR